MTWVLVLLLSCNHSACPAVIMPGGLYGNEADCKRDGEAALATKWRTDRGEHQAAMAHRYACITKGPNR